MRIGRRWLPALLHPIPWGGAGKVQVSVLSRTVEYKATAKEALPTGAKIVVVAIVGSDTVEVAPAQV